MIDEFNFSEYEFLSSDLVQLVKSAGEQALVVRENGLSVEVKTSKENLVTTGDQLITDIIKPQILSLFPNCKFLDEESKDTHGMSDFSGMVAVLDPIDGTGNYFNGYVEHDEKKMAQWGVSLGIMKDGEIMAGIIYQPDTKTIYFAEKGHGAYKNSKVIHVSETSDLSKAKLIYSPPYKEDEKEYEACQNAIRRFQDELNLSISNLYSQVLEICQVAEGNQDIFVHFKTKPWDVAAGICILREAGGAVTSLTGDMYHYFGDNIAMTNGVLTISPLHDIAKEELQKARH